MARPSGQVSAKGFWQIGQGAVGEGELDQRAVGLDGGGDVDEVGAGGGEHRRARW